MSMKLRKHRRTNRIFYKTKIPLPYQPKDGFTLIELLVVLLILTVLLLAIFSKWTWAMILLQLTISFGLSYGLLMILLLIIEGANPSQREIPPVVLLLIESTILLFFFVIKPGFIYIRKLTFDYQNFNDKNVLANPTNTTTNQENYAIAGVQLSQNERLENAATEQVNVPDGVKVKVKRSRTIARSINIQWDSVSGIDITAGIKDVASASVRGEIKRLKGEGYQESETIEYEVELNGERTNQYELIWIDTWRQGTVELHKASQTYFILFEFREKTELRIKEMGNSAPPSVLPATPTPSPLTSPSP